jgi:ubiquitin fusion degradation protein 1
LTQGEVIAIEYNGTWYHLSIVEVKPTSQSNAISIIETDINLEFAPPLDYVEPTPQPSQQPTHTSSAPTSIPAGGQKGRGTPPMGNSPASLPSSLSTSPFERKIKDEINFGTPEDASSFKAFTGKGYTIR